MLGRPLEPRFGLKFEGSERFLMVLMGLGVELDVARLKTFELHP